MTLHSNAAEEEHPISRINLVLTSMILINCKVIRIATLQENHKIKHFTQISETFPEFSSYDHINSICARRSY